MFRKLGVFLSAGLLAWVSGCGQGEQTSTFSGGYSASSMPSSVVTQSGDILQNSTYFNGKLIRYEIDAVGVDTGSASEPEYIETWNYNLSGKLVKHTIDGVDLREFYNLSQIDSGNIDPDLLDHANEVPDFIELWLFDGKGKQLAHTVSGNNLTDNTDRQLVGGGINDYVFSAGNLTIDTAQETPDYVELFWYDDKSRIATKQVYLDTGHSDYSAIQGLIDAEVAAVSYDPVNDLTIQPEPSFLTVFFDANTAFVDWFNGYPGAYTAPYVESYYESTPVIGNFNAEDNPAAPAQPWIYLDLDEVDGYNSTTDQLLVNLPDESFAQLTGFWLSEVETLLAGMVVKDHGQGNQFYVVDLELRSQDAWGVQLVGDKYYDGAADELAAYKQSNPGHRHDIIDHFLDPSLDQQDVDADNNPEAVVLTVEANGNTIYRLSANTLTSVLHQKQSHAYSAYEITTVNGPQTVWLNERSEFYGYMDFNPPMRFDSAQPLPTVENSSLPGYPQIFLVSPPVSLGKEVDYTYDSLTGDLLKETVSNYLYYLDPRLNKYDDVLYPCVFDACQNSADEPLTMDPNIMPSDFMIKAIGSESITNYSTRTKTVRYQDERAGAFLYTPQLDSLREETRDLQGNLVSIRVDEGDDGSFEYAEQRGYDIYENLILKNIDIEVDDGAGGSRIENRRSDWDYSYWSGSNILERVDFSYTVDAVLQSTAREVYNPAGKILVDADDSDANGSDNVRKDYTYDPVTGLWTSYTKTLALKTVVNGIEGELEVVIKSHTISYHATDTLSHATDTLSGALLNNSAGTGGMGTTVTLTDTTGFSTTGKILVDSEIITYTGISGNDLTGITRGADGTSVEAHSDGAVAMQMGIDRGALLNNSAGTGGVGTTVTLTDTTGFSTTGKILVDSELITYTGITGNDLTGITRGTNGTSVEAHSDGAVAMQMRIDRAEGYRTVYEALSPGYTYRAELKSEMEQEYDIDGNKVRRYEHIVGEKEIETHWSYYSSPVELQGAVYEMGIDRLKNPRLNGDLLNDSAGTGGVGTSVTLTDTTGFSATGKILVDSEIITYTGINGNDLTGITRGVDGTFTDAHSDGATIQLPSYTQLNGDLLDDSAGTGGVGTSVTLTDTTGFSHWGKILVDSEIITYTGISGNYLTGITRGADGTSTEAHSAGAAVIHGEAVIQMGVDGTINYLERHEYKYSTFSGSKLFLVKLGIEDGTDSLILPCEIPPFSFHATDTLNGELLDDSAGTGGVGTSVTLTDTTGFSTTGKILVDSEIITYTGISGNDLTGITRGADGTSTAVYSDGATAAAINNPPCVAIHDIEEHWDYRYDDKLLAHWRDDDPNRSPLFDVAVVTAKSSIDLQGRQPGDDDSLWNYSGAEFFEEWEYGLNGELLNHKIDEDGNGDFDIFERQDWF